MEFDLNLIQNILAGFGGLVLFASVAVKFTETKKDDEIVAKIRSVLDYFSVVTKK